MAFVATIQVSERIFPTSRGAGRRTLFRGKAAITGVSRRIVLGVALGPITSPKHQAGILVIAVLATQLLADSGEIFQCLLLTKFLTKSGTLWLTLWALMTTK